MVVNKNGGAGATRVLLYARYSSDKQSDRSTIDQLRDCRAFAERQGWTVVDEYAD
jgi:DNA invertase Pin-like site-specific DNA recombinase